MADTVYAETVSVQGARFHTDECVINSITAHVPFTKLVFGALDTATIVSTSDGLPVSVIGTAACTQSGTWNITNISGTISLPTGAATAAKQPALGTAGTASSDVITIQGIASMTPLQIADNGGSITVDGTVAATQSGTWTVTGAGGTFPITDSGGSITVDGTVAATQSGTWSVRAQDGSGNALTSKAAGSERGLSVAILDGSGNQITSFGGGTQYQEDAAHSSGDTGTMALAVRNDSDASLCGTTGDYSPLQLDANGYLKVNIKAGAGSGGTASTDDAAFTAASGSGTPMMGFVTSDTVDSGDVGVVGMLANRQLKVTLYDSGGVELAVGGGTQYDEDAAHSTGSKVTGCGVVRQDTAASLCGTDGDYTLPIVDASGRLWVNVGTGTVAATQSGTWNITNISGTVSLPTGASTLAEQQTQTNYWATSTRLDDGAYSNGTLMMSGFVYDDATINTLDENDAGYARVSANRNQYVQLRDGAGNERGAYVNSSGELSVICTQTGTWTVTLAAGTNTNEVVGDAAHGAAVAGNPILNGLEGRSTEPTAVDDGDVVRALATLLGKQVLLPYALPAKSWSYAAASGGITNTTGVTVKTAAGASVRNYVTRVSVVNGHASTSTEVIIRDGAAGTVLWRGWAQAAGGGCSAVFDPPLRGTANTLVQIENVTTGAATYFNLQGYEAAE